MSGEDILNVKLLFFMAKRIGRQPTSYHYIDSVCFKRINGDIKVDFSGERHRPQLLLTTHLLWKFIQDHVVIKTLELPIRVGKVSFVVRIPRDKGDPERVGIVFDVNSNTLGSAVLEGAVRV